jgi:hypothetical protein
MMIYMEDVELVENPSPVVSKNYSSPEDRAV